MGSYQSLFIDVDVCTPCGDNRTTLDSASDSENKCGKLSNIDQTTIATAALLAYPVNCADQSVTWTVEGLFTKTTTILGTRQPIRQLRRR